MVLNKTCRYFGRNAQEVPGGRRMMLADMLHSPGCWAVHTALRMSRETQVGPCASQSIVEIQYNPHPRGIPVYEADCSVHHRPCLLQPPST